MKFKLTITKEIIRRSLLCGTGSIIDKINEEKNIIPLSCAFALAFNELIPNVLVEANETVFYKNIEFSIGFGSFAIDRSKSSIIDKVENTKDQIEFIERFDSLYSTPLERFKLAPLTFEVEIPEPVIDYWFKDYSEMANKIANSKVLKLV